MFKIFVIIHKESREAPKVVGSRSLPVYTTRGRAEYALSKIHKLSTEHYEVVEFAEVYKYDEN